MNEIFFSLVIGMINHKRLRFEYELATQGAKRVGL